MQKHRELIVEPIGLNLETLPRPIDFAALFGNDHPVEIEIGIGKGTFITEQAKARPEVNFLGTEWPRWSGGYSGDGRGRIKGGIGRRGRAGRIYFLTGFVRSRWMSVLLVNFA